MAIGSEPSRTSRKLNMHDEQLNEYYEAAAVEVGLMIV
jgi:hypothetical protein